MLININNIRLYTYNIRYIQSSESSLDEGVTETKGKVKKMQTFFFLSRAGAENMNF